MKVFRVVTEHDGETTKVPGRTTTDINRMEYRYGAATIQQVWDAILFLREDPECTVIALIEECSGLTVLKDE
jgi:hypothetical protein